ncbi:hypothetical protein AVT43_gp43 [Polaribacter phage P12002L]|uniref:Uncharacterized protein n=2 Tax=Incheonvirus TaxID=2976977 RepID=A0A0F7IN98_9CAUD|nr:hypothetical protein AVT42_gp42 [Polaribacter phage P12002S]YP_009209703.1 hypothetical protein AVT43_gp43 [Polaribacter phage P12002L]AKG94217.1 hypothetical protein P12002L_0043 [Polaribacter phage P12002L]AKG94298.1 hypothetical protein P12002S_0042 [Polaribacter phage P12002S]
MSNIQIYKPPLLAVLEQEKKLREYNDQERLFACKTIIDGLLLDLGVGTKADVQQHIRAIKYLCDECGKYSVSEIQKAFSLAISGKLEIDLFQQVNVLVIGKVLNAFDNYKKEKLKVYRLKQKTEKETKSMSDEEAKKYTIQAITLQVNYFLENRSVDKSRIHVYDIFDKMGLMPTDIEYKNSVKKDAIEILKKEYSQKKASSKEEFNKIKTNIKLLEIGEGDGVIAKCKELALEDFLRKETKKEKFLEIILSKYL